jgi:hypothetical protein
MLKNAEGSGFISQKTTRRQALKLKEHLVIVVFGTVVIL